MKGLWWWQGRVFDVLVVLVAVAAEIEIAVTRIPRASLVMPAALLYTLPLLFRRRWPFAMPTLVIGVQVMVSFLDVPGGRRENWGVVAYVLAMWAFGAYNRLRWAVAGLGVALAGIVVVTIEDVRAPADEALSVALVGSLTWLAAVVLRRRSRAAAEAVERAAVLEQERRDAEVAVVQERARIARELHDVVAHSVSVMTVQAGAARLLLGSDPDRAIGPLLAVEETGRQALVELRRLLGVLRTDPSQPGDSGAGGAGRAGGLVPQPDLGDLPGLLSTVREAGVRVDLVETGQVRPVAPGVGLAAYRIIQEALTNALKHAAAGHVLVTVDYGVERLRIEVRDDGRQPQPAAPGGQVGQAGLGGLGGHGLAGMRERAAVYGGVLEAGPQPGGGFAVRAVLPVERAVS